MLLYIQPSIRCRIEQFAIPVILSLHVLSLAYLANAYSPVIDELGHLVAGLSYYEFGTFSLYKVNPPLIKALGALPVYLGGAATDWSHTYGGLTERSEWIVGGDFVAANGPDAFYYFKLARFACIPLSVLGALSCYWWAKDLYGRAAGLFALGLWCVSPTILTYDSLLTPDGGATSLGVFAGFCFRRWLLQPTWGRALTAGVAIGLAELTKMTWVVLFIALPLTWLIWHCTNRKNLLRLGLRPQILHLSFIFGVAVYVLNAGYLFEGSCTRLGNFIFVSEALSGVTPDDSNPNLCGNRFANTVWGEIPVLLPANYLLGADLQRRDFEIRMWSYLRGEHRYGGWWYYYLYAFAVKETSGFLCCLALTVLFTLVFYRSIIRYDEEILLLFLVLFPLALVSSQMGFNHHYRYAMIILPFLFIYSSKIVSDTNHILFIKIFAWLLLIWATVSSYAVFPHCLSYFNEFAGGPKMGHYHLSQSNVDWGQDLNLLNNWWVTSGLTTPLYVNLESRVPASHVGITSIQTSSPPASGWYAMSVNRLHDRDGRHDHLLHRTPDVSIGYSIVIFRINIID